MVIPPPFKSLSFQDMCSFVNIYWGRTMLMKETKREKQTRDFPTYRQKKRKEEGGEGREKRQTIRI